jgi:hypothetical protein
VVPAQWANELTIDFGAAIPASPLTITYQVRAVPTSEDPKQFVGNVYYTNTGRADEESVLIGQTAITPQAPVDPYMFVSMYDTYNLLAVPYTGTGLAKAEDLAQSITNCTGVWKWVADGQYWSGHAAGSPANNFNLVDGDAYLAAVSAPSVALLDGTAWATPTFTLKNGYNLISLSQAKAGTITQAEELAQSLKTAVVAVSGSANCTGVWKWDAVNQTWSGHATGSPANKFAVSAGGAYLTFIQSLPDGQSASW